MRFDRRTTDSPEGRELSLKRKLTVTPALAVLAVAASVFACQAVGDDGESSSADLDAMLVCSNPPQARSYVLFDGSKLEEKRSDESVDANRARFKPFGVMADEYKRVLGAAPPSLASASATFQDAPDRWFAEPAPSGVTLNAIYAIGLEGCSASMAMDAKRAQAPTADTASAYCKQTMETAWGAPPADDEVGACVDLAVSKLSGESDPKTRWAHVCAAILTSSQFLTY